MPLSDDALRELIRSNPDSGWRAFIDQYTPLLVGLIRRAGVDDRDEAMEIYIVICERLSANGFERLKSQDAARGSIGGWLAVLTRHAVVDWVRSKKGRRRLFHSIADLPRFDQRVFELYYWDERTAGEIAEILGLELRERVDVYRVLETLERVQSAMTDRHRAELLALAFRSKAPVPLEDTDAAERVADPQIDPESAVRIAQLNARFEDALHRLPAEDAAIVRLKYVEGLANSDIELAIGASVTASRVQAILARLRSALEAVGVDARDLSHARQVTLESEP